MARHIVPFGPWRGCVTSREKIALNVNELGPDSINWQVSPEDGRLVRRGGSTIQIDTLSGGNEVAGAMEAASPTAAGANRASQFVPLLSPSVTDGYETPSWLIRSEASASSDLTGTLVWISRNDSSFHQLGLEFGVTSASHYRQDGAAGEVRMKIVPYVVDEGSIYGRFNTTNLRQYPFAGARRVMKLSTGVYSPGAKSCPYWWNECFNDSATSGTEKMRAGPWGLYPPLWAPATTVPAASTTAYNWQDGDTFWEAWAFKFADGSVGPLFRPSESATTPARGGLITVGTVTGTSKYLYRIISGIPLGPKGPVKCVGRIGFRGAKVHRTLTTDPNPSPDVLYPFVEINDNTTTTINDYRGGDDNLTTLDAAYFDQFWPPRAKGAVAVDGRTILWGDLRFNPYAIIIAPTGAAASRDLNLDDENTATLYQTVFYHVRITTSNLYLKRTTGGATSTLTVDFATYDTLQKIVDKINETAFGDAYDEWSAQLVPGVQGTLASTVLRPTTDTGDEDDATVNTAPADATTLNCRAYCAQYPFVAAFTETYLDTLPTDTAGLWMSNGTSVVGDGVYSQFRNAPGHRKGPTGQAVGKIMGVEPCNGPGGVVAIVFYERGRFALRNKKSGGSRDNVDYELAPLDTVNGCVSSLSCFSGPGFAGCFGLDGVWVTDGTGQGVVISRDHLDEFPSPGQLSGDLSFAARTDAALAAKGLDTFTWLGVIGDKIRIRYRKQDVAYCENGMDYWFGRGENASGFAALFKVGDDGSRGMYGWSCPNRNQKVGVHGMVTAPPVGGGSVERRVYAWQDTNAGTADGRVDEVDKNATADDNDTDFGSSAFTACLLSNDFEEFGLLRCDPMWRSNDSTLQFLAYLDVARNTSTSTYQLGSSGSSVMRRNTIEFEASARGNLQSLELKIFDSGDGSGAVEVRKFPVEIETSRAATRYV